MTLSREERRKPLKRMHEEMDYTLCNAECSKTQCARNKKNRVSFAIGKNLKKETTAGSCDNYYPKSCLTCEKKRIFKIII